MCEHGSAYLLFVVFLLFHPPSRVCVLGCLPSRPFVSDFFPFSLFLRYDGHLVVTAVPLGDQFTGKNESRFCHLFTRAVTNKSWFVAIFRY